MKIKQMTPYSMSSTDCFVLITAGNFLQGLELELQLDHTGNRQHFQQCPNASISMEFRLLNRANGIKQRKFFK